MKKTLIVIIFLLLSVFSYAQERNKAIRLRCEATSISFYNETLKNFNEFEKVEESDILIVIYSKKIIIYSNEIQSISILTTSEKLTNKEGKSYFLLECVDKNGIRCDIMFYVNDDQTYEIYLMYSDVIFYYGCVEEK